MRNWTDNQLKAIRERGSLLVSAGAGSGKTAVLVERILNLLEKKEMSLDRILVVTFTRAAAREMKSRIRQSLRARLRESNGADRRYFAEQLSMCSDAHISTLHAFCRSLINKYYQVVGVDPSSYMLSDAESKILYDECIEAVFEDGFERGEEDFLAFADKYTAINDDRGLKECIIGAYAFLQNLPEPDAALSDYVGRAETSREDYSHSPEAAAAVQYITDTITSILAVEQELYQITREKDESGKYPDFFEEIIMLLEDILFSAQGGIFPLLDKLSSSKFPSAVRVARVKFAGSEQVKRSRDDAKAAFDELRARFAFSAEQYYEIEQSVSEDARMFAKLIRQFGELLEQKKRDRGAFDFSDLEQKAILILKNESVRRLAAESFDYVFVDEYQDINDVQEYIISRVARADNLFCVGDVKQAIYRFRGANPGNFLARYDRYKGNFVGELIYLNTNFRTEPRVIAAINRLFSELMFADTGGVDYLPDEILAAGTAPSIKEAVNFDIVLADSASAPSGEEAAPSEEPSEPNEPSEPSSVRRAEAMHTAQLVSDILQQEYYDEATASMRRFAPSDIAVIDRSMRAKSEYFTEAFKQLGIPADMPDMRAYYDEFEVSLMISELKVIDNEYDDIPLLAVLNSFLYSFTPDELVSIRALDKKAMYFHSCLHRYPEEGADEKLKQKITAFLADIARLRAYSRHVSVDELLKRIYAEKSVLTYVSALPDGNSRRANLVRLSQIALDYEQSSLAGLYSFILFAEKCRRNIQRDEIGSGESGGVRLLTAHASKGLEFGCVIVTGMFSNMRASSEYRRSIFIDKSLGICPSYVNIEENYRMETLKRTSARLLEARLSRAEELRILYVAATRAKNKLCFVGALKDNTALTKILESSVGGFRSHAEILSCSNYGEWLLGALGKVPVTNELGEIYSDELWRVNICKANALIMTASPAEEQPLEVAADADIADKLREVLGYRYPTPKSADVPSKLSVSQLKEETSVSFGEKLIEAKRFASDSGGASITSGAAAGTLVHLILQQLDFAAFDQASLAEGINNQLDELCRRGLVRAEELDASAALMVEDFLKGDLGKKLLRSKKILREQPFILSLDAAEADPSWAGTGERILVQGIIDCMFELDGDIYLLDFKTDRIDSDEYLNFLNEKYSVQLRLYARAITEFFGKAPEYSYLCYLRRRENVMVEV